MASNRIAFRMLAALDPRMHLHSVVSQRLCHEGLSCRLDAKEIFKYAISKAQPDVLVKNALKVEEAGSRILISNKSYCLSEKKVHLVGVGKAAMGMAATVQDLLKDALVEGIVLVPCGTIPNPLRAEIDGKLKIFEGARNNLPDMNSVNATKEILNYVKKMKENDILITLISGGASALLCAPIHPVTLDEKRTFIQLLTSHGADIHELNIVRKQLSSVKGGKLADIAYPAQVISLILSDVIGDPLDLVGSGPTVRSTASAMNSREALAIIDKYNLNDVSPASIIDVLRKNAPTNDSRGPKSELILPSQHDDRVDNYLIGNNGTVLRAAVEKAGQLGYTTHVLSSTVCGTAKSLGQSYARLCRLLVDARPYQSDAGVSLAFQQLHGVGNGEVANLIREGCSMRQKRDGKLAVISSGETVVNVVGDGKGGRNQESALSCCIALKDAFPDDKVDMVFLSAGTDGIDGPTDAAGALAYIGQADAARVAHVEPDEFLTNNDSNGFFNRFNEARDLIMTGSTGTNFMDLHVLLINFNPAPVN